LIFEAPIYPNNCLAGDSKLRMPILTAIRIVRFHPEMTRCKQELAGGTPRSTSEYRVVVFRSDDD